MFLVVTVDAATTKEREGRRRRWQHRCDDDDDGGDDSAGRPRCSHRSRPRPSPAPRLSSPRAPTLPRRMPPPPAYTTDRYDGHETVQAEAQRRRRGGRLGHGASCWWWSRSGRCEDRRPPPAGFLPPPAASSHHRGSPPPAAAFLSRHLCRPPSSLPLSPAATLVARAGPLAGRRARRLARVVVHPNTLQKAAAMSYPVISHQPNTHSSPDPRRCRQTRPSPPSHAARLTLTATPPPPIYTLAAPASAPTRPSRPSRTDLRCSSPRRPRSPPPEHSRSPRRSPLRLVIHFHSPTAERFFKEEGLHTQEEEILCLAPSHKIIISKYEFLLLEISKFEFKVWFFKKTVVTVIPFNSTCES
uniref:Uncharacterized protein n=1 Tax=Oryza sativa subsp. japonica TaxID=39947 RepID=Q65WW6_ORYSJ|nr:unknown protein [Oryza sativa Japonica Group]